MGEFVAAEGGEEAVVVYVHADAHAYFAEPGGPEVVGEEAGW